MKAHDFRDHCVSVATWVNWEDTKDIFLSSSSSLRAKRGNPGGGVVQR